MILTLWAIILGIGVLLLFLGYAFNITMSDVCVPAGWIIFFILGLILLFNGVTYVVGSTEQVTFNYDERRVQNPDNPEIFYDEFFVNSSSINKTNVYDTYTRGSVPLIGGVDTPHIIGFLLMILGAFGFMTFWFDTSRARREDRL